MVIYIVHIRGVWHSLGLVHIHSIAMESIGRYLP